MHESLSCTRLLFVPRGSSLAVGDNFVLFHEQDRGYLKLEMVKTNPTFAGWFAVSNFWSEAAKMVTSGLLVAAVALTGCIRRATRCVRRANRCCRGGSPGACRGTVWW